VAQRKEYGAILADPPWHFRTYSAKGDNRAPPYARMSLDEIKALRVDHMAAPDCVLFLWFLASMLQEGLDVARAWGFTPKTVAFTWVKTGKHGGFPISTGFWTRRNCEQCLLATRGHPKRIAKNIPELIMAPRREHSRKPDEVRTRIQQLVPGPYLEMFARERAARWNQHGDQIGYFDDMETDDHRTPAAAVQPDERQLSILELLERT
jgi:N6-adenosine-specific RNA methylase IME4